MYKRRRRQTRRRPYRRVSKIRRMRFRRRPRRKDTAFVAFTNFVNLNVTSTGVSYNPINVRISDFGAAATYLNLYEQYKIVKLQVKIVPKINMAGAVASNNIAQVGDHGIVRCPATAQITTTNRDWTNFINADYVKIRRGTQTIHASCIPNIVSRAASVTGSSTTPAVDYGQTIYKPWIVSGSPDVLHFGWQHMWDFHQSTSYQAYLYVKAYVMFKGRVNAIYNPV